MMNTGMMIEMIMEKCMDIRTNTSMKTILRFEEISKSDESDLQKT